MRTMLILMAVAMMAMAASCDNLTGTRGGTLLENWRFAPSVPQDPTVWRVEIAPWKFNPATCLIPRGKGGDGNEGYIALQYEPCVPSMDDTLRTLVGVASQQLSSPIRAGRTYTISISGSLSATIPCCGKVASSRSSIPVRFYAYNGTLEEYPDKWTVASGKLVPMREVRITGKQWKNYSTISWTADADYTGFAFCIGDMGPVSIPEGCESDMVFLDNVILQEWD